MLKEIKYLIYSIIITLFIFFSCKYYFSDTFKKKSFRSLADLNKKIEFYSERLPILENNTQDIIVYVNNEKTKKKKSYSFWELIDRND